MLNLLPRDTVVTLGSAGGLHTVVELPLPMTPLSADLQAFTLKVSGLIGGHSGVDIDKNRANANALVARNVPVAVVLIGPSGFLDTFARARVRTAQLLAAYRRPEQDARMQSELRAMVDGLAREAGLEKLREKKKVVVSMGSLAACWMKSMTGLKDWKG